MNKTCLAIIFAVVLASPAAPTPAATAGPYAGQQARDIASLSRDDVADLLAGRGWGLAKPAELNGYPGPRHVLDLGRELALDDAQKAAMTAVFQRMNREARRIGAAYVDAERALDAAFRSGRVDGAILSARLSEAGRLRDSLRQVHLAAHLDTAAVLSDHQRRLYQRLRGYADGVGGGGHDNRHPGGGHR